MELSNKEILDQLIPWVIDLNGKCRLKVNYKREVRDERQLFVMGYECAVVYHRRVQVSRYGASPCAPIVTIRVRSTGHQWGSKIGLRTKREDTFEKKLKSVLVEILGRIYEDVGLSRELVVV